MKEKTAVRETAEDNPAPGATDDERMIRMLDPEVLGRLNIDIIAQLGHGTISIGELAALKPGEVVALDTPLNGMVDLTLNGAVVARAEIVAVDDRFGVRITEILARKP